MTILSQILSIIVRLKEFWIGLFSYFKGRDDGYKKKEVEVLKEINKVIQNRNRGRNAIINKWEKIRAISAANKLRSKDGANPK